MKTIQEIKDEVAQAYCMHNRDDLLNEEKNKCFDDAMKAYGEMLLREAAERARTRTNDESTSIIVDKKSILSIIDEMK